MLTFDYETVHCEKVEAVTGFEKQVMNDGSVHYERILIRLASASIAIDVNQDTDELIVSLIQNNALSPEEAGYAEVPELGGLVGRELGWCWEGRNYRGYYDFFSLSVNTLYPDFGFVGIGSSIQLHRISKIPDGVVC
jgi:hypothetical protein